VNLFFHILHPREDGFHEIASLYQAIDLCDVVHVECASKDSFTCSDPLLPMDESNLVIKALHLFRTKTGIQKPLRIHLEKKIPMQAGLGGGSSNAATALWAFSKLLLSEENTISEQELRNWAVALGSDVPFFLSSGLAYCTGRGEVLTSTPPLAYLGMDSFWIAKPQAIGLSTPLVYQTYRKDRGEGFVRPGNPQDTLASFYTENPLFYNDLEIAAFSLLPSLKEIRDKLKDAVGFSTVLMSGSGTSFFCLGEPKSPELPGVSFFSVKPCMRKEQGGWYESQ
jgi:4-diphosphocytidyl-2-C-methyl-D-erythritol kinase